MAKPKKRAPNAKKAYTNGIISTQSSKQDGLLVNKQTRFYPRGLAQEIVQIDANNGSFLTPISRKITREVRAGFYPNGFVNNDTVYVEIPERNGFVRYTPRVASKYEPNGEEYEILKKRFNEAKSVSSPSKKQQGGQLNMNEQELQQAFIQFLAQKTGAKTEQELEQVIQQLGEDGLKKAYSQFIQSMQEIKSAKFGAKLDYIKQLRGICPEGTETKYYKVGGKICKKCIKKQVMQDPIDQFKCGRKIKKKKCEAGGIVDIDKCGAKIKKKKCEAGGFIPFDKCGKKMKKC